MSIRKRGNGWQVRVAPFRDQTFPTKEAAEVAELDLKLKKKLGHLYQERPTLFGAELDAHLDAKTQGKDVRPATVRFHKQSHAPWQPLREIPVPQLRRSVAEPHIRKRHRKAPVAARNELQFAKAALREAESRGQRVDPGIYEIRLGKHFPVRGRALEPDKLDEIASWMPERAKRIVLVCGTVGFRWTEAVSLEDSMLDLDRAQLEIPARLNKSRRDKPVPLAASEVKLLREQLLVRPRGTRLVFPTAQGGRYSESGFRKVWHRALKHSDLEGFKFHWLRHTAISLMARSGMKPEVIAARVGHSDGGALIYRTYRHLYPAEVSAAVGALDAFLAASRHEKREAREA